MSPCRKPLSPFSPGLSCFSVVAASFSAFTAASTLNVRRDYKTLGMLCLHTELGAPRLAHEIGGNSRPQLLQSQGAILHRLRREMTCVGTLLPYC